MLPGDAPSLPLRPDAPLLPPGWGASFSSWLASLSPHFALSPRLTSLSSPLAWVSLSVPLSLCFGLCHSPCPSLPSLPC